MTVKKQSFWQQKKQDFLFALIIAFVFNFLIGTWLYSKYTAIDNAREKVEKLHKEYTQVVVTRKAWVVMFSNYEKLLKLLNDKRIMNSKEYDTLLTSFNKMKLKVHTLLSNQKILK